MEDPWIFAKSRRYDLYDVMKATPDDQLDFCAWLAKLLDDRGESRSDVIRRSCLDRTYAYQIFSGRRAASRDKLIQLARGMRLDIEQTSELLERADLAGLRPYKIRDAAIAYAIVRDMSVPHCDEMLFRAGLATLRPDYAGTK